MCKNNLKCKYCNGTKINKFGKQNNKQRYICRECRKTFIMEKDERKKYSDKFKMEAIRWYLDNCGIRTIERRMKVTDTTIIRWIREFGKMVKEEMLKRINDIPDDINDMKDKMKIEVLEGDEIVSYVKKSQKWGKGNLGMDIY